LYQDFPSTCVDTGACDYTYGYGDGSSTSGVVAYETFTFTALDGSQIPVQQIAFGCGQNESLNGFNGNDGLVGLGQGNFSLPSQLSTDFSDIFSYCLVPFADTTTKYSTFYFGVPETNISIYTPIVSNTVNPSATYYYVNVTGISVGGVSLDIPADTFDISPTDGSGGIILDSGTTLNLLTSVPYEAVVGVSHYDHQLHYIHRHTELISLLPAAGRQTLTTKTIENPKNEVPYD